MEEQPKSEYKGFEFLAKKSADHIRKHEHVRGLGEIEYAQQIRTLFVTGIETSPELNNSFFQIKKDNFETYHIRWLTQDDFDNFYWLFEMTVSNQNRIRLCETFVDEEARQAGGNIEKMEVATKLHNFPGEFLERRNIERTVNRLQMALITKLAADENQKLELYSYSVNPENKLKFFSQACQLHPEEMKNAHLIVGFKDNIRSIAKAAKKAGLISARSWVRTLPLIDRLPGKKINLKKGLKIQKVPGDDILIEIYFPGK